MVGYALNKGAYRRLTYDSLNVQHDRDIVSIYNVPGESMMIANKVCALD
jgi:hypothetical protein